MYPGLSVFRRLLGGERRHVSVSSAGCIVPHIFPASCYAGPIKVLGNPNGTSGSVGRSICGDFSRMLRTFYQLSANSVEI